MSFKENLKTKIKLDGLLYKINTTIRETPGQRRLDKRLTQELIDMTDFEYKKVRDLPLYVRPLRTRPWKSWSSTTNCQFITLPWTT